MVTLISYVGKTEVLSAFRGLDQKIKEGDPILAINKNLDVERGVLLAIFEGHYNLSPFASSDRDAMVPVIATEASFLRFIAPRGRAKGRIILDEYWTSKRTKLLLKDPRLSGWKAQDGVIGSPHTSPVYITDEVYLGRDAVVDKLVEMLS